MNNNNINNLDRKKYLISRDLQIKLCEAQKKTYCHVEGSSNTQITKDNLGINIIVFRVLNKKNKILVYNYVNYMTDFFETLIVYFILRSYFIKRRRDEGARKVFDIIR